MRQFHRRLQESCRFAPLEKKGNFFDRFSVEIFLHKPPQRLWIPSHTSCANICFFHRCCHMRIFTHVSHSYTHVNNITKARHIVHEAPCWYFTLLSPQFEVCSQPGKRVHHRARSLAAEVEGAMEELLSMSVQRGKNLASKVKICQLINLVCMQLLHPNRTAITAINTGPNWHNQGRLIPPLASSSLINQSGQRLRLPSC